uniref:Uncharacterized protein n=1 Tax=Arundo donax TaxID=35708 RepID=A0A0A9F5G7_ARUDO
MHIYSQFFSSLKCNLCQCSCLSGHLFSPDGGCSTSKITGSSGFAVPFSHTVQPWLNS